MLGVELDGGQHSTVEGRARDDARTVFLAQRGIRVIRITNYELLVNTEATLDWLWREVMKLEPGVQRRFTPHPNPLPKERGTPPPFAEPS